ncbi:alpha/beta fold hydrolase [Streptomyces katsurahamanus]|uniref:Alpha/beta hydrolase n=1 Tax=Streptomyces katsurahamanus TaxID=2577098 RepID=A0ABW9NWU9_9ACTN|nr:alpha/beta hydrolase [Streptomyces katsurahamanus]MQS37750.1 alpha/beta hydrolase [Streptomyces katsurahamanus]
MTEFVLVPGGWLGGWAWREVAAELRAAGHGAHPVTLTGLGDRRHLAGPQVGLSTHVEDVVAVLESEELTDAVVVGHSYGILPATGAVDRVAERTARLVHLDSVVPQDGKSLLDLLVTPRQAEEITAWVAEHGEGWRWPMPPVDRIDAIARLDGVSRADRERLARLGAPQPLGTATEPLRLTGAVLTVPATGVFCTRNGNGIARAQELYDSGDPAYMGLAARGITCFELDTGHWPMFSAPAELARVLCAAAAGHGHSLLPRRLG